MAMSDGLEWQEEPPDGVEVDVGLDGPTVHLGAGGTWAEREGQGALRALGALVLVMAGSMAVVGRVEQWAPNGPAGAVLALLGVLLVGVASLLAVAFPGGERMMALQPMSLKVGVAGLTRRIGRGETTWTWEEVRRLDEDGRLHLADGRELQLLVDRPREQMRWCAAVVARQLEAERRGGEDDVPEALAGRIASVPRSQRT
mgnify:CR=1 FL=1